MFKAFFLFKTYILLFKFVSKLVSQYVISKNMQNARYGADTPHSTPLFFNGEPFTPVCDVDDCCKHVEYVSMWSRILRKKKRQMFKYVTRVNEWRFANTSVCDIAICLFLRISHLCTNCDPSQQNRAVVCYQGKCDIPFIWKSILLTQRWYHSCVNWMQHCNFMVKNKS